VVAHDLIEQRSGLQIPPFVAVDAGSVGPGCLGVKWSPFSVNSSGEIKNLKMNVSDERMMRRLMTLNVIEKGFIDQNRGPVAGDRRKVLRQTLQMMRSDQIKAFKIDEEPEKTRSRYGTTDFGNGCLMARRLVEAGVPFIEVGFKGWDNHENIFPTLKDKLLPKLDRAMSALVADLHERELLKDTLVLWMGEFGRSPRINKKDGRDHWSQAWSVVLGGAGIKGGIAVGETHSTGTRVETEPHASRDIMATAFQALGISLEQSFTTGTGEKIKIANGGKVIEELLE